MWDGVSVIQRPVKQPISPDDVRLWARIDHSDEEETLLALIQQGVSRIDGPSGIGIAMMKQTWRKSMDCFPSTILLPGWPIKQIVSITYVDSEGVSQSLGAPDFQTDLDVEPVRITPAYGASWPAARSVVGAVKVDYQVGEESASLVHPDLIDALKLYVAYRFDYREAGAEKSVSGIPLGIPDILARHRRSFVAA